MVQVFTNQVFAPERERETTVLADTNVLLSSGDVQELSRVFARMGVRIAVTRNILKELRKKNEAFYNYASTEFEVINDYAEEIVAEARFIYTHPPDNSVIAAAKVKKIALISYDQVLLKVAAYQGVDAYRPEELMRERAHAPEVPE